MVVKYKIQVCSLQVLKLELRTPPPDAPQPPMVAEDSQELQTETESVCETETNLALRAMSLEKVTLKELANQRRAKSEESMKKSVERVDVAGLEEVGAEVTVDGRINVDEEVAVTENAEDETVEGHRELEDKGAKVEDKIEHVSLLEGTKDTLNKTEKMLEESVSVQTVLESDSVQTVTDVESGIATDGSVQTVTESVETVDESVHTAADDESRESDTRATQVDVAVRGKGLSAENVKSELAMKALLQEDSATDSEVIVLTIGLKSNETIAHTIGF